MQEYALAIGLVGLSCVTAFGILSPNILATLSGFMASSQPTALSKPVNQSQIMTNLGAPNTSEALIADAAKLGETPNLGTPDPAIFAPSILSKLSEMIETEGVDGTTHELAQAIKALADTAPGEELMTPEQMALFDRLANQGHRLASIQTSLKTGARKGVVSIDGKRLSMQDGALAIGAGPDAQGGTGQNVNVNQFPNKVIQELGLEKFKTKNPFISPDLAKFVRAYDSLRSTIPASNTQLRGELKKLSKTLLNVNNTFAGKVFHTAEQGVGMKAIERSMADEFTHSQSAAICDSDNRTKDTGKHCDRV